MVGHKIKIFKMPVLPKPLPMPQPIRIPEKRPVKIPEKPIKQPEPVKPIIVPGPKRKPQA